MVTVVVGDDWGGVYKDGVLVDQGHDWGYHAYTLERFVEILHINDIEFKNADPDWLADEGWLPVQLDEVRFWD